MTSLEDERIIALYEARNETAILESKKKYGRYCLGIAHRILKNGEDAEECENDTYLDAWKTIPPARPRVLSVFLGTITRRIALDRWRREHAEKRGGSDIPLSLSELEDCIPADKSIDDAITASLLAEILSRFLRGLPEAECSVFLLRYRNFWEIREIAAHFGFSEGKVKMMLLRTREKLKTELSKEGIFV